MSRIGMSRIAVLVDVSPPVDPGRRHLGAGWDGDGGVDVTVQIRDRQGDMPLVGDLQGQVPASASRYRVIVVPPPMVSAPWLTI